MQPEIVSSSPVIEVVSAHPVGNAAGSIVRNTVLLFFQEIIIRRRGRRFRVAGVSHRKIIIAAASSFVKAYTRKKERDKQRNENDFFHMVKLSSYFETAVFYG